MSKNLLALFSLASIVTEQFFIISFADMLFLIPFINQNICIESSKLDSIRPHYGATLVICSQDDLYSVRFPLEVLPGPLYKINAECIEFEKHLLPGSVIKKLVLEILDRFGNHVEGGVEVLFGVDGLCFQDQKGLNRKVDHSGYIDLSGGLKVSAGYGQTALIEPVAFGPLDCFMYEKEGIERRIDLKGDTAASVICNMLKYSQTHKPQIQWMQEIFGIVALLGKVCDNNISRIFAEYFGGRQHACCCVQLLLNCN